jgi:hypothetical protein
VAENKKQTLKQQREQIQNEQQRYAAIKDINDLLESQNNISKAYGTTLKAQLADEGKITNVLQNRIDLVKSVSDITAGNQQHSKKALQINNQIKEVEKTLAGARGKNGKFQKGFNNLVEKGLITDIKMLRVQRDKQ